LDYSKLGLIFKNGTGIFFFQELDKKHFLPPFMCGIGIGIEVI
jgi:hypothetical protein